MRRAPESPFALPLMMGELAAASWETMWHRGMLMLSGQCTAAEYRRMVAEKMAAMQAAGAAAMEGRGTEAMVRPFHKRATANARRLRK